MRYDQLLVISNSLDTPEGFFRWLQGQEPGSIIGYGGSPRHCPLGSFLNHFLRGKTFYAYISPGQGIQLYSTIDSAWSIGRSAPSWTFRFMKWADMRESKSITREEAMEFIISLSPEIREIHEEEANAFEMNKVMSLV